MLRLAKHNTVPPGGYVGVDEDTGHSFKASSLSALVTEMTNHRLVNKLEVAKDYAAIIEDRLCKSMPKGICISDTGVLVGRAPRTAYSALSGTFRLGLMRRKGNFGYVSYPTAQRRAQICAVCRNNKPTGGCTGCRGIKGIVKTAKHDKKTSFDEQLHVCTVAIVFNAVQVHLDDRTLRLATSASMKGAFPKHCWRRKLIGEK